MGTGKRWTLEAEALASLLHSGEDDSTLIIILIVIVLRWGDEQKPFASMVVGTSPEFELALYTTCLLAR